MYEPRFAVLLLLALHLSLSEAVVYCQTRTGPTCVPSNGNFAMNSQFPTVFTIAAGICTPNAKMTLTEHLTPVPGTCKTTVLGCCCAATSAGNSYDICEQEVTTFVQFAATDPVSLLTTAPVEPVTVDSLNIPVDSNAATWLWNNEVHLRPLVFNSIMYPLPSAHIDDINSYKIAYFSHHFSKTTPFTPVIESLAILQRFYIAKKTASVPDHPKFPALIHHALNNLYQGIKTFRFIVEEKHQLDETFATQVGDHVFANSLIGDTSDLQNYRAKPFNPYQVVGHADPKTNIDMGKLIWKNADWKKEIEADSDVVTALLLVANVDCSAWARLYQRNMRMVPGLVKEAEVEGFGPYLFKDIQTNIATYVKKMKT